MIETISGAARAGFPVELLLKVTLVLAAAALIVALAGRASAATRYMVWQIGVAALLVLPLLSIAVPRWDIPIERGATATVPGDPSTDTRVGVEQPIAGLGTDDLAVDDPATARGPSPQSPSVASVAPNAGSTPAADAAANPPSGLAPWGAAALLVWAAGALILLVRVVLGWLGTRRLSRRSKPVREVEWLQLLKDARWTLDVDREVTLLRSPQATMPMTWGIRRPTILLPEGAESWPEERQRVVMLHEMAHVARRDCLTQTVAEIACALYWFHPLVWVASRGLRTERERACDDRVLRAGEEAADYAGHLLELARAYRRQPLYSAAAIGMARPSQLEGRLLAVLDGRRRRAAPGRREVITACTLAAIVLIPLAALRAVEAQHAPATAESPALLQQIRAAIGASAAGLSDSSYGEATARLVAGSQYSSADSTIDLGIVASPGGIVEVDLRNGGNLTIAGPRGVRAAARLDRPIQELRRVHVSTDDGSEELFIGGAGGGSGR